MAELSFDDYSYHARSTAYFLDTQDQSEQFKTIYYGYNEEVGELLTDSEYPKELTSKLWGLRVDDEISRKLTQDKVSEAGDVLYYISASGTLRGISLREVASESLERFTGHGAVVANETFKQFDQLLSGHMGESVPPNYRPNYHTWKMWDFAPFEDMLHIVLRDPTYAKGPLKLIGDGRYALERLHSTLGRFMLPETGSDEEYVASAGLALGGLSIVLQHRFDSSLEDAAQNNIAKRERRLHANVLESGNDPERSRIAGEKRPRLSQEESTNNNLLNAPLAYTDH